MKGVHICKKQGFPRVLPIMKLNEGLPTLRAGGGGGEWPVKTGNAKTFRGLIVEEFGKGGEKEGQIFGEREKGEATCSQSRFFPAVWC